MRDRSMPRRPYRNADSARCLGLVAPLLAMLAGGLVAAPATAQESDAPIPEWGTHRSPADAARPAEYRTVSHDTWMRLSPYMGLYSWSKDLQIAGRAAPRLSGNLGLRIEFDPADLMLITFDIGFAGKTIGNGFGANAEREVDPNAIEDVSGKVIHLAGYIGLKNPDLKFGPLQIIFGAGLGAFYLFDYSATSVLVQDPGGGGGIISAPIDPPFADTWLVHATLVVRADVELSQNFQVGFDLKFHLPFYAAGDQVGDLPPDELELKTQYLIFEPTLYFSLTF